ncbi:MAG: methylated-DNA--[protein]-cysteine S-methyltransferase [Actinomycetota bacterium]|nr:methylated-DNA--[protein]-cysteine S-methyltransferase [Acidimicrobiia bacterium]MDQ3147141.1 methylated-DNA--[protein]-cysteine S-methyltransferase [Actinomycetota bacterium]
MDAEPTTPLSQRLAGGIAAPIPGRWEEVRARLAEGAAEEGLLDVAYASVDSPIGTLLLAATEVGVVRVAFDDEAGDTVLGELAARVSPRVLEAPSRLDDARRELEEYFDGRRTRFGLPVDWQLTTGFRRQVLGATAEIPYGSTGTYTSVATAAGSARAVRAAGTALATNPVPVIVPCHRVLRSDGALGGYRGGADRKEVLLRHEAAHQGRG